MNLENHEDFYEDFWSRTEDQRIYGPVGRHTRRLIKGLIKDIPYRSVLDVGCGEGSFLKELKQLRPGLKAVGADLSVQAVKMAAQKNPEMEFKVFDLRNGPLNEKYDLLIFSEVIEHVEDDAAALSVLARMTDGYLLLTTLGGRMRRHESQIGHLRNYDPEELCRMIEGSGFNVRKMIQWGWPFFSPLHRNLLEMMGDRMKDATTGEFGVGRKIISILIYFLFFLNSWRKGDQLVILAEKRRVKPEILPLEDEPKVSIVIPVKNEEFFMDQCVKSLKALDYPSDKLEVIFADGRSEDRTAEMARSAGFKVVDNPGLTVSAGRNKGFAASTGRVVAFTDADCKFDPKWIRNALKYFEDAAVAGVSGPTNVPDDQDLFGKAVGSIFELAGKLGATVHLANVDKVRETDDIPGCNAFYRREVLDVIMPVRSVLSTNEDVEMNAIIREMGFRLLMTSDIRVEHYKRSTPMRSFRQMHAFAIGRLKLGRRDHRFLKPSHWAVGVGIPLLVTVILITGCINSAVWAGAAGVLVVALFLTFVLMARIHGVEMAWNIMVALVCMSTGWLSGFLRELFYPLDSHLPADDEQ